jgi:predicted flavoprotein YhiN
MDSKMNERIRELAEQSAGNYTQTFHWEYLQQIDKDIFEKFAELLIRECVMTLDEDDGTTHHRELLFTHFGVE